MQQTVFDYIKTEETAYQTLPITVVEGYEWSMFQHIKTTILYKNSQLLTGKSDDKPVKNIILPILRLQYRTEGFDVKDIVIFVNEVKNYFKSFLVKKFHEKWARQNDIDEFIDQLVESYVDFGGTLVKDINDKRPENVPWPRIAFCDQTNILGGPICEAHQFAPDELEDMAERGWGDKNKGATITIEELIVLSQKENKPSTSPDGKQQNKTPGKHIKIYELHGRFPKWWLTQDQAPAENEDADLNKTVSQLHIVAFYQLAEGEKKGVTLYKGKEKKSPYKLKLRDPIYGRGLGLGGAEELFEPQVWTTYDMIRMKGMLDAAGKTILKTTDSAVVARHPNGLKDLDNLEIIQVEEGKDIGQLDTFPKNLVLFERSIEEWQAHAQQMGAANDSIMGEKPAAGTPFKLQELVTAESHGLHDYRRGKLASFVAEIYRDWIIPWLKKEVSNGDTFLAELDLDELQAVADSLVTCQTNDMVKEKILNGEEIQDQDVQQFQQKVRANFMKGGNKKFIEILRGEMSEDPLDVEVNVAGKQKDLSAMTDKLVNIFRQIIANPAILDDPRLAKIFNEILEYSGFSPIDFSTKPPPQQNNGPGPKVSASINFKDLPPDGQQQLAEMEGIKIGAPQSTANQPTQ